jgi:hypothetical protein
MRRSHTIQEVRANGASHRLPLERLPASAPERHPDEGVWPQLKGVELRNVCGFDRRHLRAALRPARPGVRQKPRILTGCFAGAGL